MLNIFVCLEGSSEMLIHTWGCLDLTKFQKCELVVEDDYIFSYWRMLVTAKIHNRKWLFNAYKGIQIKYFWIVYILYQKVPVFTKKQILNAFGNNSL